MSELTAEKKYHWLDGVLIRFGRNRGRAGIDLTEYCIPQESSYKVTSGEF
jgi:hypothetical protein